MRIFTFILLILMAFQGWSQNLANFEDITIPQDSFLNGSEMPGGGYRSGNFFFPNNYDTTASSWVGWAISNKSDTTTAGFMNQYSAISGAGAGGSSNYAVSFGGLDFTTFASIPNVLKLEGDAIGKPLSGLRITNGTYAYLSMKNGDSFAKKFGGASGEDPDYFRLTIKAYYDGNLTGDSVDFYLADFRFADNSQDYIVDDWTFVDLSSLGNVDSLIFILNSTDVGQFGMNTPAYFCVDNVASAVASAANPKIEPAQLSVFPNPSQDYFKVNIEKPGNFELRLFGTDGKLLLHKPSVKQFEAIDIAALPAGLYLIKVSQGGIQHSAWLQKR